MGEQTGRSEIDGYGKSLYAATADMDDAVIDAVAALAKTRGVSNENAAPCRCWETNRTTADG